MEQTSRDGAFEKFCSRLRQEIAPYAGRVEYGNLRHKIDVWETGAGRITNVALVYETPGGSTDQINVSFDHEKAQFSVIDEAEHCTDCVEEVLARILPRVANIPVKRREAVCDEIRRQFDSGIGRAGLFGHITRYLQSDFKGGTITHQELQEAMRFAIQYSKGTPADPSQGLPPGKPGPGTPHVNGSKPAGETASSSGEKLEPLTVSRRKDN
jgi:hypothetical protein